MPDDMTMPEPAKDGLFVAFLSVEELFAGPYTFDLPWFQRAYAWTEETASRLLDDICGAYENAAQRYFIGHILLARKADEDRHTLVDGQQRAVTLMILFALLRHRLDMPDWKARLSPLLEVDDGTGAMRFRLSPQPVIKSFFEAHIQATDAIDKSIEDFDGSEVEANILANRHCMNERLDEFVAGGGNLSALAEFVLTRCLLILEVVEGETDDEAWKMLQVEESTGIPFHDSARAKVAILEAMPPAERDAAAKGWEKCQTLLGDDGMQLVIKRLRDLSSRQRSSKPVENDILKHFKLNENGLEFVEDHLLPTTQRLVALRDMRVGTPATKPAIAKFIRHLHWAGQPQWYTAAIRWLEVHGDTYTETEEFFFLLSRKLWLLRICGADSVELERRCIALSNEIKDGLAIGAMRELKVSTKSHAKARDSLLSRTFYDKRYARLVLRYLSDLLGEDSGTIDGREATIEHVLPRHPGKQSLWYDAFGGEQGVRDHAHRLGNLALLTFADNQRIGNAEYAGKRPVLRASGFSISADAASANHWTPDHVLWRSEALTKVIFDHWRLAL